MMFVVRMAVRETRASWRRLLFFFICIAVGVAAIVALRSVIESVRDGVNTEARALVGADVVIATNRDWQADARAKIDQELAAAGAFARTETTSMPTMVRPADRSKAVVKMAELRSVEAAYPLYGTMTLQDGSITRAFSMANPPDDGSNLRFIIKKYPNGAFSSQLDGKLAVGDVVTAKGPYGTCFRREERPGPMLLIGGGSGMSPLWSILADHIGSGEQRPVRFFYGARTRADLFYLDELAAIAARLNDFKFVPALSHAETGDGWDGETGLIHEVVLRHLREEKLSGAIDAYACGPTPMIDAVLPVLQMNGVEPDHIYFDKFTPAVR